MTENSADEIPKQITSVIYCNNADLLVTQSLEDARCA